MYFEGFEFYVLRLFLLIVGSLATGATRHQIYTGFRSRLGGRIATGFVSFQQKMTKE
jgi:hypothetical protein